MGFVRQARAELRLLHVYVLGSLALYLFWLPGVSYDRFLMPLLPFLLLFGVKELQRLMASMKPGADYASRWMKRAGVGFAGVILVLLVGVVVYGYATGLVDSFEGLGRAHERAREDAEALAWINSNTGAGDVVVCYRDPMYYLYTGRKAVRSLPMNGGVSWSEDEKSMKRLEESFFRIVAESGGRLVVMTSSDFDQDDQPELHRRIFKEMIERHPERFERVFDLSGGGAIYRVRVDPTVRIGSG
jgi:hypothetical protein